MRELRRSARVRFGRCRQKLDDTKRQEIAEAVVSGRKTAAQTARMFGVSPPTVRIADLRETTMERTIAPDFDAGSRQLVEQRFCFFQITHVEAFGEPLICRREQLARLGALALL